MRAPTTGLTIKTALMLGFGLTAGLWLLTGLQFARRIEGLERESSLVAERYMEAQEQLSSVRGQVLVASVLVRDALLDTESSSIDSYRQRLEDLYASIDQALEQYVPVVDSPAERETVQRLRLEIDEFRNSMRNVLVGGTMRSMAYVRTLLNRDVVPRRDAVIRVSEEIQALNRSAFVEHQTGVARIHAVAERQTWQRLGFALAVSFAIALIAILYTGRLETRLRRESEKNAQNTRYLQSLSEKLINAQEEERRRISRELHDEVGQLLTALKIEVCVAERTLMAVGGSGRLLDDVQAIADTALHTVRDLSRLLHPSQLDDLGLPAAVEWYVREFGKRYGIKVEFHEYGMAKRLAPQLELAAYRVVQEALTNIAKHAYASSAVVALRRRDETVEVTVADDGRGFAPEQLTQPVAERGLGLMGMRERVARLRGTVRIESEPGHGTRVVVTLPAAPPIVPTSEEDEAAAPVPELTSPETLRG